MGMHTLIKSSVIRLMVLLVFFLLFSACVTEDQFLYLSKRIDAVETKTEKELLSNSERMASNSAEMDRVKEEMQSLNGRLEENSHRLKQSMSAGTVADLQKRISLIEMRLDRISSYLGLEPVAQPGATGTSTMSGTTTQVQPDKPFAQPEPEISIPADQKLYDINMDLYRKEKYEESIAGFKTFLKEYPKSKLADNAAFWIGESHMALKQYEQAILAFQKVIKQYPKGNKVPNALLRQALAFDALNDKTSAKLLLRKLIKQYPKSNEAKIAKNQLNKMK